VTVAFTVRTSLRDQDRNSAVTKVLETLLNDVDSEAGASHIDMTVRVTMPKARAESLLTHARGAGATPVVTEL
jgi:hypothetical protein